MFRKEAITAKRQHLHGDVFLFQPLSFRILGYLVFAIIAFCFLLLMMGSYARSEVVVGHLVPAEGLVKIQASAAGTLESIFVNEGEKLRKGQKIAIVRSSFVNRQGVSLTEQALLALALQESEVATQLALESNQLETELAGLQAQIEDLDIEINNLKTQSALQQSITLSLQQGYDRSASLLQRGFISKTKVEQDKQAWLRQAGRYKLSQQELTSARSKYRLLQIRKRELPIESEKKQARLRLQRAELDGRRVELVGQSAFAIESPVNGTIVSISVASVGYSLNSGQVIMTILPEGSPLVAELFVPSRAIGFVEKKQEVRLLYDAFPYEFFGSHQAVVNEITAGILGSSETLAPFNLDEPVYRVRAKLHESSVTARGRKIALQTGMTLRANIILERRSFLDWLMSPLHAVRKRS